MITTFDHYVTALLTKEYLGHFRSLATWNEFESALGKVFLALLRPFLTDLHIPRDKTYFQFELPEYKVDGVQDSDIRLGAVNFRGLYQRNGRETTLEPCGLFAPKAVSEPHHRSLHKLYMRLVHKAKSINQLFLATTDLKSLTIEYCSDPKMPCKVTTNNNSHAHITVSSNLMDVLVSDATVAAWEDIIKRVLTGNDNYLELVEETLTKFQLLQDVDQQYQQAIGLQPALIVEEKFNTRVLSAIVNDPSLLQQWLLLPLKERPSHFAEAGELLEAWLRSIFWLRFYCRDNCAGSWFYTVRLPNLLGQPDVFPDSSFSLVSGALPNAEILDTLNGLGASLGANSSFLQIKEIFEKKFDKFVDERRGPLTAKTANLNLAQALSSLKGRLPLNFDAVVFLLKMARQLVAEKHEGQGLRFCFILGFSRELVDAESGGIIEEHTFNLQERWNRFLKLFLSDPRNYGEEELASTMVKWIKSNDLQLQPYDTALFFEEHADVKWPVPTSLIRLRYTAQGRVGPVATEVHLRAVLRHLTNTSRNTIGVLVCPGGLVAFFGGHAILLPCHSRSQWKDDLYPELWDSSPIELKILDFFTRVLEETFSGLKNTELLARTANILDKLIETLVTIGHGAIIVVRQQGFPNPLSPLNPVWCVRNTISDLVLDTDYITYALMAALDGATEIVLPAQDSEQKILFGCRKFVQGKSAIWQDVPNGLAGEALVVPEFKEYALNLLGRGTRHHSALGLSKELGEDGLVITVSADGPVNLWRGGNRVSPPPEVELKYAP